jgi:hypothetical protein
MMITLLVLTLTPNGSISNWMATVSPYKCCVIDVNDSFNLQQDHSSIFVSGVHDEKIEAVEYLPIGRAIEDGYESTVVGL